MKVVSLEDARRAFIATVKLVRLRNKPNAPSMVWVSSRKRENLDVEDDYVYIPSRGFNECLTQVLRNLGLHQDLQKRAFIKAFVAMGLIVKPTDADGRELDEITAARYFNGRTTAKRVYIVDRVRYEAIVEMTGVKAKNIANADIKAPLRTADWTLAEGNVETTFTVGTIQDVRYESVIRQLNRMIEEKGQNIK